MTPDERFAAALRGFLSDRTWAAVYDLPAALAALAGVDPGRVSVTVTADTLRLDIRADGEAWAEYAAARDGDEPCVCDTGFTCMADDHKGGMPS